MERLSNQVSEKITLIETVAERKLESPDGHTSTMHYHLQLNNDYQLHFENVSQNVVADVSGENRVTQNAFLSREEPATDRRQCQSIVVFSCLLQQQPVWGLRGVPFHGSEDMFMPNVSLSAQELAAARAVLKIADWTSTQFAANDERDIYTISPEDSEIDQASCRQLCETFLNASGLLLAEGALVDARYTQLRGEGGNLLLKSSRISGGLEHVLPRDVADSELEVSLHQDETEYLFERRRDGSVETRVYHGPEWARYQHLESFVCDQDEATGKMYAWGVSKQEFHEQEQKQRDMGMFVPELVTLDLIWNAFS